jgi:aryl sulfotransferase
MLLRQPLREYRTWALDSRYWHGYVPRPNDIIIGTAPKCGTTWMQQIVSSLVFQDSQVRALPSISPWVEARFRFSADEVHAAIAALPHRRFLKTHLPIDALPLFEEVKYIYVGRDGRDAALSMHNHSTGYREEQLARFDAIGAEDPVVGRPYPRPSTDLATYFREWVATEPSRGPVVGPPSPHFFELASGYWGERHRPNFLLVHYADLSRDLGAEMRRIAAFLEIQIDHDQWPSLVLAASFETMRASGERLMPFTTTMFTEGASRFFHKGTSGRWRGVLSQDDVMLYESRVQSTLSPGLAEWLEGGRAQAGDPRSAPD